MERVLPAQGGYFHSEELRTINIDLIFFRILKTIQRSYRRRRNSKGSSSGQRQNINTKHTPRASYKLLSSSIGSVTVVLLEQKSLRSNARGLHLQHEIIAIQKVLVHFFVRSFVLSNMLFKNCRL